MYLGLRVECPLFLSDFNHTWSFSIHFFGGKMKYQISRKPVQWEPNCSVWMDR